MKSYYVYILASKKNGTLYIGVTSDLEKRMYQHKCGLLEGFTKKYNVKYLVYFEETTDVHEALLREKRLKTWKREWKLKCIEKDNPSWRDLSDDFLDPGLNPG
ncbi:MAG: GIY-YIG nuclease family protein [bacterium]|nr:GIY-YIG nuclease family protein [bacterium]